VFMAFFYAVVLALAWQEKQWRRVFHGAHWLCLALSLAPLVLWGVLVRRRLDFLDLPPLPVEIAPPGSDTPSAVWSQQVLERLSYATIDWGDWLVLPFRTFILFAPFLLWAVFHWWRRRHHVVVSKVAVQPFWKGLFWGCCLSGAAFCLLPATRARYMLPLMTPALLWAVAILRATYGSEARLGQLGQRICLGLAGAAVVAAVGIGFWGQLPAPVLVGAVLGSLAACGVLWLLAKNDSPQGVFLFPSIVLASWGLVAGTTLPSVARKHENVRSLAEQFLPLMTQEGSVVAFNPGPQPMLFYLGERCVEAVRISQMPRDTAYVLISPADWQGELGIKVQERGFTEILKRGADERSQRKRSYILVGKNSELPQSLAQ
jgi:hypothetical protein